MKKSIFFFFLLVSFLSLNSITFCQPDPPTELTATQIIVNQHPAVKLVWQGSNNMERYKVFKRIGGLNDTTSFIQIAANLFHKTFVDHLVLPEETYSYFVKAFNTQGISDPSDTVEITVTGLPDPALITGTVFDDANNEPIIGARVQFIFNNNTHGNFTAFTNNFGEFRIVLPPATYFMRTSAISFIPEFYDNVPTIQEATSIVLASGDSLNFNTGLAVFVPPVLYTLSGHVEDESGNPLRAGISAVPVRNNSFFSPGICRGTVTDSLGNYTIQVRENDTVVVYCRPYNFNFAPEFWDNKVTFAEADRIIITGNITGIDFIISPKPVLNNGISGLVKNQDNEGVQAHITAFNMSVSHHKRITTTTDSVGNYSFTNMIPGQYILLAHPEFGYLPTFFRYDGTPTLNWIEADSIEVIETSVVTGIDFTVLPVSADGFAKITGNVKDNAGSSVRGAIVFAADDNLNVYSYAITDATGNYVMEGLQPGDYMIVCDKVGYTSSLYKWININYTFNTSAVASFTLTPEEATSVENEITIENYQLFQNYPNPFNPGTVISLQIPVQSHITLKVFDVLGREVATLMNEEKQAGKYSISFDASGLSSGIYFYTVAAGNYHQTNKMVLAK